MRSIDTDDSDYEATRFEICEAIYCYASLNHDGQWSELYRILCESPFRPGPLWSESRCLKENSYIERITTDEECVRLAGIWH